LPAFDIPVDPDDSQLELRDKPTARLIAGRSSWTNCATLVSFRKKHDAQYGATAGADGYVLSVVAAIFLAARGF